MKIRTLTVDQAREIDRRAQSDIGIPALILMENAGIGLAKHIRQFLIPPINKCQVVMVCGTGNNGGDAFVAARHLKQQGVDSQVFLLGEENQIKAEAAVNYRIIKQLQIPCEPATRFEERRKEWSGLPVLIIDALVGTGFKGPMRDPLFGMVRQINDFKKNHNCSVRVLAVDVPSGFDGDLGAVTESVRADITVTFACIKSAMVKPDARPYVGRIEVVDIGIPENVFNLIREGV